MIKIGLTGGIATGKSTATRILRDELGVPVIDADIVAREVVAPGQPALEEIAAAFGPEILDAGGVLRRKALGKIVMSDPAQLQRLNGITHPRIFATIRARLATLAAEGAPAAAVDAAILIESGRHRDYDVLWVVSCPPEVQIDRLMARNGFSREEALRWIGNQMPLAEKEALADRVIWNDGTLDELRARLRAARDSLGV